VRGQRHVPAALTPERDQVPIVQEAVWPPGSVRKGAENLAPTMHRSADRPVRSESSYRLHYPGPRTFNERCLCTKAHFPLYTIFKALTVVYKIAFFWNTTLCIPDVTPVEHATVSRFGQSSELIDSPAAKQDSITF
jgi:hypothetical protein